MRIFHVTSNLQQLSFHNFRIVSSIWKCLSVVGGFLSIFSSSYFCWPQVFCTTDVIDAEGELKTVVFCEPDYGPCISLWVFLCATSYTGIRCFSMSVQSHRKLKTKIKYNSHAETSGTLRDLPEINQQLRGKY